MGCRQGTGTRLLLVKSYLPSMARSSVRIAGEAFRGDFWREAVMRGDFWCEAGLAHHGWCKRVTSRLLSAQRGLVAVAVSVKRDPPGCKEPEMHVFTSLSLQLQPSVHTGEAQLRGRELACLRDQR